MHLKEALFAAASGEYSRGDEHIDVARARVERSGRDGSLDVDPPQGSARERFARRRRARLE